MIPYDLRPGDPPPEWLEAQFERGARLFELYRPEMERQMERLQAIQNAPELPPLVPLVPIEPPRPRVEIEIILKLPE